MRHTVHVRYLVIAALLALSGCSNSGTTPDAAPSAGGSNAAENTGGLNAIKRALAPKPIVVDAGTEIAVTADMLARAWPEAEYLRISYVQIGDCASGTFEPFSGVDNIANRVVKMSRSL